MTKEACLIHVAGLLQEICHSLRVLIACLVVFWPLIPATHAAAQQGEDARDLIPGRPVERDLAGGETHLYKITLNAGDYLRVFINSNSQSTKIRSQLLAPGGSSDIGVYFFPTGGQERFVSLVAELSGDYKLEIRRDESGAGPEHYGITVEEMRPATEQDRTYVAAESVERQGMVLLRGQGREPGNAWQESIHKFEEALRLWRRCGDHKGELRMLNRIGMIYGDLGEPGVALRYFKEAVQVAERLGDGYQQANMTMGFGRIYRRLGEYQKALDSFNQARSIFKSLSKRFGEATAVYSLGLVLEDLAEYQDALARFEEALPTISSMGDHYSESAILNSMGTIYCALGDPQKAIELHSRALAVGAADNDMIVQAISLGLLGSDNVRLGDMHKAMSLYEDSLRICSAHCEPRFQGDARYGVGQVAFLLGENRKALDFLNQALQIFRTTREQPREARVLSSLAKVNCSLHNLDDARTEIEQAIEIEESIRLNVIDRQFRENVFTGAQSAFAIYVDLLMQLHQQNPAAGYEEAALQANERARARSLLEVLTESRADIREGVPQELLMLERSLEQQINAKAAARTTALSSKGRESEAADFDEDIAALTDRLREVEARIRQQSPRYAALTQPQPLTAAGIGQQLDDGTVLLEFALGEQRSWLWAVTRRSINSYQLPPGGEIEASARRVYEQLTARQPRKGESDAQYQTRVGDADSKYQSESAALSKMLLGQIAGKLQEEWKEKRLAIVAPGALEYLPFAALPSPVTGPDRKSVTVDPKLLRPLIAQHEIVNLPSASALAAIRGERTGRQQADRTVAVVADPVFEVTDPRVANAIWHASSRGAVSHVHSRGEAPDSVEPPASSTMKSDLVRSLRSFSFDNNRGGFSRLPFSREEAEAISLLVPKDSMLKATDFQANRALATSGELSHYRIVHFATHGLLNAERPELSGLVLSLVDETGKPRDGFLRMNEIYNLRLPADLVVLSACQTALGKEIKGEGLVGLTRGFMYAGAQRVVASLWQVDDLATAQLMKSFYRDMLKERLTPPQALRLAQLEMLKQQRWSSPYFWAPFVIQGEWR